MLVLVAMPASSLAAGADDPGSPVSGPSRADGSTATRLIASTVARKRLSSLGGGRRIGVQTSWSGQPQKLLVLDSATRSGREWLKVLLPVRPNGSAGWIRRDRLALSRTRYWIDIDLSARKVSVFHRGKRVRRLRAVVGAPGTPTPVGLAAVYERNRQPRPRRFPRAMGPVADDHVQRPGELRRRTGSRGDTRARRRQPPRSARKCPFPWLHPRRQWSHLLDGLAHPGGHTRQDPAMSGRRASRLRAVTHVTHPQVSSWATPSKRSCVQATKSGM